MPGWNGPGPDIAEARFRRLVEYDRMDRWSKLLLLLATLACAFTLYLYPLILSTPLLDPDEGIHAVIARDMVERDDYVVPRFRGKPFRDKPILYFAAQAFSLRTFGMNETAVRLPGFAFALLGSLTTVVLAWRMFDRETAAYAGLASLTLVLPLMLSQAPAHDIALVPWTNLLVLACWEQERATATSRRWLWVAAASVCVALALLTKGLIGIAVIACGLGLYAVISRTVTTSLAVRIGAALVVGSALASPWFLKMEQASPGYLRYYFLERHVLGYITEGQEHGKMPWHFYFAPVLGGAMPWLFYAVAAVLQSRRPANNRGKLAPPVALLGCWFVGGFLFLTLANSKLLTYTLPIFPPIAILAGLGFRQFFHTDLSPIIDQFFKGTFRLAAMFGMASPIGTLLVLHLFFDTPSTAAAYGIGLLASLAMAAGLLLFERRQGRAALAVGMLWYPLSFAMLMTWPVQTFAERYSQRSLALLLNHRQTMPSEVLLLGQRVGSVLFYLTPEKRMWLDEGRIREVTEDEFDNFIPPSNDMVIAATGKDLHESDFESEYLALRPHPAGAFFVLPSDSRPIAVEVHREGG